MHNLVAKGVPDKKIVVLPNYIDLQFLKTSDRDNGFRRQHLISPDEFLVMYSGSIALKQGLQTFVETSAGFCQEDGITFYLIGEGPYLQDLKRIAETLKLTNFYFLPLQPRERLPVQLSAADALVITQKRAVTDVVFPGKLLYYMAAARPILAAVSAESETGRFVRNNEVGLVVPPENPQALAKAIQHLHQNRGEAVRLGMNGRRIVEERFDRKVILRLFANHLEYLAKGVSL
jgi:colanic acid biosynthesis glycosyl transferase WcaI